MKGKLAVLEEQVKAAESTLEAAVQPIGNLVHESVPVSNDEVILYTVQETRRCYQEHLQAADHTSGNKGILRKLLATQLADTKQFEMKMIG